MFPIILPRGLSISKLIVRLCHQITNHSAGTNFILSQIREKYLIFGAREVIKECETTCNMCKRMKNNVAGQVMGMLTCFTYRAFDQTSVEYAAPFSTVQGRGKQRQKRWLCLFTCVATRAIYLELAWGLDTDSVLNTFARLTNRRVVPTEMPSNNETNFVAAVNEFKTLVNQLNQLQ